MKIKKSVLAASIALAVMTAACSDNKPTAQQPTAASEAPAAKAEPAQAVAANTVEKSGIELDNFDASVRHQDDFYLSVNGTWLKNTPVPSDRSNYGSFTVLHEESQLALREIIEAAAAAKQVAGSEGQKVGDFYNTFMDEQAVEQAGIKPIAADLAAIDALSSHSDVAAKLGEVLVNGGGSPFGFYVNNDAKQSDKYIVYLYQSGLGLPDRDYYFKEDEKSVSLRQKYRDYVAAMLAKVGHDNASDAATAVLALETQLAEGHWTRVESRDANKAYNKMTSEELAALLGSFDFPAYAKAAGLDEVTEYVVRQPSYLEAMGKAFDQVPVEHWQAYLKIRLLNSVAGYLSSDFVDLNFDFYRRTLRGIEEQQPRWKLAVQDIDSMMGEAVGKLYVEEHFKPEAKERMETLVANLIKAFEISIKDLDWMTEETKVQALDKLGKFTPKIGYPDKWRDYSALEIVAGDLVGNVRRAANYEYQFMLDKLGKPIDKTEWHMTPQTVNAYYNPVNNEIVFPAAILQPPFFDMEADDAVNYGGIGAVIGHEIGHGFDDQGSKYDGDGNLRNWWTDADREAFEARTSRLVEQYNGYFPFEDAHVNGEFTLGENIGDLGGLSVAYKALQLSLNGQQGEVIDGLTSDQRFFIGWSQVWRRNYREEELRQRLVTDPHSPSHYRVIGVVSNIPEFYSAFDVKETDEMFIAPEDRVKIW
ncbi:peptidase M13 [Neiella marina]|uniref:Peptidase M13 n=1 Tax=Neiella marina TaxID=508461 RepID=A0A8J2U321_9GAMM|nr:M13-type metalloendopeptidase [Neiella marina]GGA68054.1 peptidase M13 [Neiella marina]